MRIVTAKEMRDLDQEASEKFQIPPIVLMENAGGQAAARISNYHTKHKLSSNILVFAGKGNNGGDALVVARHLIAYGKKVRLFLLHNFEDYQGQAKTNLEILLKQNVRPVVLDSISTVEEFFQSAAGFHIAVDGLLGIGFKGSVSGLYADVVESINKNADYIFSLDIPTGVDATTGSTVGAAIDADETITFGFPKLGHFIPPGALHCGNLRTVELTFPYMFKEQGKFHALSRKNMPLLLKGRDRYGHKNRFGHILLLGGSKGKTGAIAMAARSALRMGSGKVTVGTWENCYDTLAATMDHEIMSVYLHMTDEGFQRYRENIDEFASVVIGPGLGTSKEAKKVLSELIAYFHGPIVIDADGINLLEDATIRDELLKRKGPTVLTPHPGEMARLLGIKNEKVVREPVKCVEEAAELTNAIVVLKGATTFINSGDERIYVNHYPNDGMATAGSGDVLAGIIGGLVGQSEFSAAEAACLGVYIHSLAGDISAKKHGHRAMTANSIIENLDEAFLQLRDQRKDIIRQI